jgi:hypothetical protein
MSNDINQQGNGLPDTEGDASKTKVFSPRKNKTVVRDYEILLERFKAGIEYGSARSTARKLFDDYLVGLVEDYLVTYHNTDSPSCGKVPINLFKIVESDDRIEAAGIYSEDDITKVIIRADKRTADRLYYKAINDTYSEYPPEEVFRLTMLADLIKTSTAYLAGNDPVSKISGMAVIAKYSNERLPYGLFGQRETYSENE